MITGVRIHTHGEVEVENGVCSGGHPLSAQAGVRVREVGGNAVDALVAGAFTAFVTEQASCYASHQPGIQRVSNSLRGARRARLWRRRLFRQPWWFDGLASNGFDSLLGHLPNLGRLLWIPYDGL